jgi:hypothetical protein
VLKTIKTIRSLSILGGLARGGQARISPIASRTIHFESLMRSQYVAIDQIVIRATPTGIRIDLPWSIITVAVIGSREGAHDNQCHHNALIMDSQKADDSMRKS